MLDKIKQTASYIKEKTNFSPEFGIVLGSGLGGLVNEIETLHALEYSSIPNFPVSTVKGVIARAERAGGDPVSPRGHKKRRLDSGEEVKLCRALEQNSTATNRELSAVVRGKVAARTVSDYLARADPPFTTKVIQDQEPEELTEEWRTGPHRWLEAAKKIRLDKTDL